MIKSVFLALLILGTHQFVLRLVQDQTCFNFYPDYDQKHHEVYFITAHDTQHHPEAQLTVYDSSKQILNSSKLHPHSHYLSVITNTTQQHSICMTRFSQQEITVHFDIIDEEHFQDHSKAGKEDMMKLARSAGLLNLNLAKFDLTQKSIFQKSRIENLEMVAETQHLYMLTLIKILVMLAVTGVQYYVIKKIYSK